MDIFENVDPEVKTRIAEIWKRMSETDKTHFINQVSLALTVWGNDVEGKGLVVDIMRQLVENGSQTLADFGIYLQKMRNKKLGAREPKVKRASLILEGYRIKNDLPSEPRKDIGL
ncbi:MAG: hypothetical protein ABII22_01395 [Candidatus Micrarchaeota archaeon]